MAERSPTVLVALICRLAGGATNVTGWNPPDLTDPTHPKSNGRPQSSVSTYAMQKSKERVACASRTSGCAKGDISIGGLGTRAPINAIKNYLHKSFI